MGRSGTSRRGFLRWSAAAGVVLVGPVVGLGGWVWVQAGRSNTSTVRFERPLAIPPIAPAAVDAQGRVVVDLRIQQGRAELLPGTQSATWGVNGPYLGPTVRADRGSTVLLNVTNEIGEPTTLHWHGMELPAVADGGPHQMIAPGATWSPTFRIDQPAATLWYHPHLHRTTKEHVYRGVAGLFLVDDPQARDPGLPHRYGVDDVPLILQDKKIAPDGSLDFSGIQFGGFDIIGLLGEHLLVNGTYGPYFDVTTRRVRFRVLNASNARFYRLGFADDRRFWLIGTDVGLLPEPREITRLQLSPGERAEILAEFAPGERVLLRSYPPELQTNPVYRRLAGGDDTFDVLELRAAGEFAASGPLPSRLADTPPIAAPAGARVRRFSLGDFTINGRTMDHSRIDEVVPLGATEIWEFANDQDIPHNIHVHNAAFHVLDVDGEPPPVEMSGRKDTVFVPPNRVVRVAIAFGPHADPRTPYMIHCHLLAHEDSGMMSQFVIVEPGQEALVAAPAHAGH